MSLDQKNILICLTLKKYLSKDTIQEIIKFYSQQLYESLYIFLKDIASCHICKDRYMNDHNRKCIIEYQDTHNPLCFDQIEFLDLSLLNLKEIPCEISLLQNLSHLGLSGNNLINLPATLSDMMKLKELLLGYNKFQKVPIVLYKMKWTRFYLGGNPLKELPCILRKQIVSYPNNVPWIE